jgi:hypothetical protein
LLFGRVINSTKCLFCSRGEGLLLGSAAEDKSKREEESNSLLEGGFLPARPVAAREGERERNPNWNCWRLSSSCLALLPLLWRKRKRKNPSLLIFPVWIEVWGPSSSSFLSCLFLHLSY